jgi:hypothetical protein
MTTDRHAYRSKRADGFGVPEFGSRLVPGRFAISGQRAPTTAAPRREDADLMTALIASLALALLLAVVALVREVRLRRALQELLRRLLTHWRHRFGTDDTTEDHHGPDADPDGRL